MRRIRWGRNFAYAVGLIATDGSLSKDGRHIALVSGDIEQLHSFAKILRLPNKISKHKSSYNPNGVYFHIQFGNVRLYNFLNSIGLTSNKSLSIGVLKIPYKYFSDFLRGCLDGDGNISIVAHKESGCPQLRLRFCSASLIHLQWLKHSIHQIYGISRGFISKPAKNTMQLTYSKIDSINLLAFIYYDGVKYFLRRKHKYYKDKMRMWRNGTRDRFRTYCQ